MVDGTGRETQAREGAWPAMGIVLRSRRGLTRRATSHHTLQESIFDAFVSSHLFPQISKFPHSRPGDTLVWFWKCLNIFTFVVGGYSQRHFNFSSGETHAERPVRVPPFIVDVCAVAHGSQVMCLV